MATSKRGGVMVVVMLAVLMMSACSGMSNKMEKSPCACDFELLNTTGNAVVTKPA